jgi:N-acetylglucosamine-6-phosphate deacetylase
MLSSQAFRLVRAWRALALLNLTLLTSVFVATAATRGASAQQGPVNGMRPSDPARFALVGAKVIPAPGESLESATILVRDGVIEAVGTDITVPAGYRVYDVKGKTLLPAFIEAALPVDSASAASTASAAPGAHWNASVTPEVRASELPVSDATIDALRAQGFAVARVLPANGILRGATDLRVLLKSSERPLGLALNGKTAQVIGPRSFDFSAFFAPQTPATPSPMVGQPPQPTQPRSERSGNYPSSLMGSYALMRQTLIDAKWRAATLAVTQSTQPVDDMNALDALQPLVRREQGLIVDAADELDAARLLRLAAEQLGTTEVTLLGGGNEFRNEAEIRTLLDASKAALILPIEFPQAPDLVSPTAAESISLRDLMTWRYAPTNPKRFVAAGANVAITSHRMSDKSSFRKKLADAITHGLTPDEALAAVTTTPAKMLGLDARVGTLSTGKLANIIVAAGDPFAADTKFEGLFIAGVTAIPLPETPLFAAGTFTVETSTATPKPLAKDLRLSLDPKDSSIKATWLSEEKPAAEASQDAPSAENTETTVTAPKSKNAGDDRASTTARKTTSSDGRWSGMIDGAPFGLDGELRIAIARVGERAVLTAENLAGTRFTFDLRRMPADAATESKSEKSGEGEKDAAKKDDAKKDEEKKDEAKKDNVQNDDAAGSDAKKDESKKDESKKDDVKKDDKSNLWKDVLPFPLGEFGLTAQPFSGTVLFRNATIWTQGPAGTLQTADMLIRDGKIAAIGENLNAPDGATIFDVRGMHITPGLIDCHSHTGISGGVNEGTHSNTAEVTIGDVIDPNDIEWYRQLAGGLTAVNQLHGSANPIGGRNSVVKIRWGENAENFRFEGAPSGIKFALGENVVRSKSRYPSSRMGVATFMDDAFEAARAYRAKHAAYAALDEAARARTLPPRKDLELETLAEIIEGTRLVHCHSYRQDEILMLLATAKKFGFRVATLQHVLEGYKVAPEIAAHGAGASSFSDWWAYKVEVMDAIPWNGAIMHRAGVLVSFNSDSDELARRMNMEAAKAVRYGGLTPEQALALVTINPAKQLRIDQRTGSLEVGKDADFAVWNGNPLSAFTRCEETWVDGVRRYQRSAEAAQHDAIRTARADLIAKTLAPAGDAARAASGDGEGRGGSGGGGMRGGRGGRGSAGGRAPTLLERMLEDREDFIWLRLARGQDPFPTKQGDCGCGPSSDVLTPSGDAASTTTNLTGPIVPVAAEIN